MSKSRKTAMWLVIGFIASLVLAIVVSALSYVSGISHSVVWASSIISLVLSIALFIGAILQIVFGVQESNKLGMWSGIIAVAASVLGFLGLISAIFSILLLIASIAVIVMNIIVWARSS